MKKKFKSRYFGNSIIPLLQKSFWFKTYQWLQDGQGSFLNLKFVGNIFKIWSKIEKASIEDQIVQKWLLATFAILTVDVSNENYS